MTTRNRKRDPSRSPTTKQIGKRLAELRKYRGLSQSEVSRRTGIAQTLISEYESGKTRMHGELIARLVVLLEGSVEELLGTRGVKSRPPYKPISQRIRSRAERIDDLPEFTKRHVLRTIDLLLKGVDAEREP